jgi:hypothetical protein
VVKLASWKSQAVWKKRRPGHKPPLAILFTFLAPAGGQLLGRKADENSYGEGLGN